MPQDLAVYLERCPVPGLAPDRIKDLMWQLLCGIDFLHRYIHSFQHKHLNWSIFISLCTATGLCIGTSSPKTCYLVETVPSSWQTLGSPGSTTLTPCWPPLWVNEFLKQIWDFTNGHIDRSITCHICNGISASNVLVVFGTYYNRLQVILITLTVNSVSPWCKHQWFGGFLSSGSRWISLDASSEIASPPGRPPPPISLFKIKRTLAFLLLII